MNAEIFIDYFGTDRFSTLIGLSVGLLFGAFAQQSKFCLRAACIEFWRGKPNNKFSIWLMTFATALVATQLIIELHYVNPNDIRTLNSVGSLSGAIIGGLMFGAGMVMARGCASRLLVLSATGNMRALVAGLVVTVVAQASLRGALSPARESLSGLWVIQAHQRGFVHWLPDYSSILLGLTILVAGLWLARKHQVTGWVRISALITGFSIALGYLLNSWHAAESFDIVPIKSVSFTGPSADTLMGLINTPSLPLTFDVGLVPGVFIGSLIASVVSRQFEWQQFTHETKLWRYLVGASLMGFGSMLAGGCAVGAGVSGGALLGVTAWTALFFMWVGAGLADLLLDRRQLEAASCNS
ncbi:MAG: YeeE/YedE family protein [Kangiellaceae bacterium]|jgi:uncharacterized membrane protein YedE/YeeE|nr:YeeE/YedE family protein [Kangiellaceae bacterium]